MTAFTKEEYEIRFKNRIMEILLAADWDPVSAEEIALAEWEAFEYSNYEYEKQYNNPVGDADDAMSYWSDDAEPLDEDPIL